MEKKGVAVVAVGGNSLIKNEKQKTIPDQYDAAVESIGHIVDMIEQGWEVVITHGNGPQVGFIHRRSELSRHELHEVPLDYCGADTQGSIGYMFTMALHNEFRKRGMDKKAVAVVTQTIVDRNDPAFQHPTKPIGSFMDEATAKERAAREGWVVVEDAGRGWRRVVASPIPRRIVEADAIHSLINAGFVVVGVGGGGIPVIETETGDITGVEAVIDKDFGSSLLATMIGADLFVISTAVEQVALNFNTPQARLVDRMTLAEARQYTAEGHFAKGSMLPKINAIVQFLEKGGRQAIITNPENIGRALRGETGTLILP
ncbi:MAG TPA: carbamate kinase [Anaerolineaceae bacterium]|jgi:carbamate kinase|nr:carbamate kinase [Longilinea sp.]NMD30340.1 carbamate kinase [Chloroflexota bacterium]HNZ00035.1 carbamate kinase [Anaerolineaceae bacterium]HOD43265.1 carbamate kinase [Anaerolineaceae bacterium]HOH19215.1 carbamate kinase [Anaerolineaceae bacterium]